MSDKYASKNMLGTKNVRYGGIFKTSKKSKSHIFLKTAQAESLSLLFW